MSYKGEITMLNYIQEYLYENIFLLAIFLAMIEMISHHYRWLGETDNSKDKER
jgi:hypothetical protein